ncbi:MAG: hypothetical protein ABMA64_33005 [Myxococcota bacterium]
MTAARWLALAGLGGCAVPPSTDATYLRLRGAVADDVRLTGDDAEVVVAWVTAADGEVCLDVEVLPFVPHLFGYEAEVNGPPDLDGEPCVPGPADAGPGPFAVGLLALLDPDPRSQVTLSADPVGLLEWFGGGGGAPQLVASGGAVAAVADGFALMVSTGAAPTGSLCRLDAAVEGLALYDDRGTGCGGWAPLAAAGERTEIQGVDLVRP